MSYQLILDGIEKTREVTSWHSLLIKYNHRTNPNEYTCYVLNFKEEKLLIDTIQKKCEAFLKIAESHNKNVINYTGMNPKNAIDKIEITNPLVSENWNSLVQHINESDDFTKLKDIKANAYIFVGTYTDNDHVQKNLYLLSRKNPIIPYKRHIFSTYHNEITETSAPLVQFNKCFDAIIFNNTIYMINHNCESIFNMEYTYKILCNTSLDSLESCNLIDDMSQYRNYAISGQTPKKFITYDSEIVTKLTEQQWMDKLIKKLSLPVNPTNNKIDLKDKEHAKNFTSAICGKIKLDFFSEGVCEVPSSIPINPS